MKLDKNSLSALEHTILRVVWVHSPCSAGQVRHRLRGERELKDSTVRTILRRLEDKGYITHEVRNRTYIYHYTVTQERAAVRMVQHIIESFCSGSAERLLIAMVEGEVLSRKRLRDLAERICTNHLSKGAGK